MMVSQEQMPFMFLIMHTLPEVKDLKQHQEKRGVNKLCMVPHPEQMPG
jgi:hypothetical protein